MAFIIDPPLQPMLAQVADEIPIGPAWVYEPKWDGFRVLIYRDGEDLFLQSRNGQPLGRYFPEVLAPLLELVPDRSVLDGELIVAGPEGLDFDALLLRLHPAASRVEKLSRESPATFVAFDLLALDGKDWRTEPFRERREALEALWTPVPGTLLTPQTADPQVAQRWFTDFEGHGLEGIVAKRLDQPWVPGERLQIKVKHQHTADCVVGGYRLSAKGGGVASLLLGLYDEEGVLHYVGHTSGFAAKERRALRDTLRPHEGEGGFGEGFGPGGPSRWARGKEQPWVSLRPELVCEVRYDRLQGGRFRHATGFLRWRPDRDPASCTFAQLQQRRSTGRAAPPARG